MKRTRLFETIEEYAKRRMTDCDRKKKHQQTETEEQGVKWRNTDCDHKTKQRHTETAEKCMDMAIVIDCAMKEAR